MAAAEFWNDTKAPNTKKFFSAAANLPTVRSGNPFKSTKSDVVVAEALIFLFYNFHAFINHSVKKNELLEADLEASVPVGPSIRHTIQETTGWPLAEILSSRFSEYNRCTYSNEPVVDAFSVLVMRSIGKRAIHDPDRLPDFRNVNPQVMMWTMAYMAAHLPAYFELYKDLVDNFPMD
jgi:hypothetical protein